MWTWRTSASVKIKRGLWLLLVGLLIATPAVMRPIPHSAVPPEDPAPAAPPPPELTTAEIALAVIGLTTALVGLCTAILGLVTVIKSRPKTTHPASTATVNPAEPADLDHESDPDWRSKEAYN